jgi:hypothetical protein
VSVGRVARCGDRQTPKTPDESQITIMRESLRTGRWYGTQEARPPVSGAPNSRPSAHDVTIVMALDARHRNHGVFRSRSARSARGCERPLRGRLVDHARLRLRGWSSWRRSTIERRRPGRRSRPVSVVATVTTTAATAMANVQRSQSMSSVAPTERERCRPARITPHSTASQSRSVLVARGNELASTG